jgi:hypothetical protein
MRLFLKHILNMPLPWRIWWAVLHLANLGGIFFLPGVEARVVLGGLLLAVFQQNVIFTRLGFVRLLGLGHFHWIAMLAWLWLRLPMITDQPFLSRWIVVVMFCCGLSLVFDTVDVVRYLLGAREPTVVVREDTA